jgi:hypothetical protein
MKAVDAVALAGLSLATLAGARGADAQGRVVPPPDRTSAKTTAAPGQQYEAGLLRRMLLGTGWRDLWTRPIELPVLDLDTFAGGLTPMKEGGNAQSVTLHFVDAGGRRWIFRSVDKYPRERLADGLDGTLAGYVVQDQISSLHPAGALVVPPLLDALGILHVNPVPWAMPDDPRLGEFRDRFAGMIGLLEEKPDDDVPDGVRRFAGSARILDTEALLDRLEEVPYQHLAQAELLRGRLFDFVVGDTDRTPDNYDWAGFADGDRMIWRPIPRDRDWAFVRADGPTARLVSRTTMPKLTRFERDHSPLPAHTPTGEALDRRLINELDRDDFEREVAFVKARLSDSLIDAAVQNLPRDYPETHGRLLAGAMKARRDELSAIAGEFYEWLASDVDIHASDAAEHVEIHRESDGTTEVTIVAAHAAVVSATEDSSDAGVPLPGSLYHRVFRPAETAEIRIFLHGGDDVAVVDGSGHGIAIRVIGGGGDDVLADSSSAPGVFFYEGRGDDTVITGPHTTRVRDDGGAARTSGTASGDAFNRDWGSETGVGVSLDHRETVGFVFGAGPTWTQYGFRRVPYLWRMQTFALISSDLSPGARLHGDYRFEGLRAAIEVDLRWSSFDAFRWFGPGNGSELVSDDSSIVRLDRVAASSSLIWRFGEWLRETDRPKSILGSDPVRVPLQGSIAVGPTVRRTKPDVNPRNSFAEDAGSGSGPILQLGVALGAELRRTDRVSVPRRGFRMHASLEGFSGALRQRGPSGSAAAEINGYIPLIGDGPHLALRAGTRHAFGDYPPFDAARVGGRSSLRGFSSGRFAGDAAAFAGTELRVPVADLPWIAPGELGVFGLLDAGRVWVDDESPGGWHTARGIGLWVLAFRQAASVAYVTGETSRLYVWLGMPY